jgi:hypothetical protein
VNESRLIRGGRCARFSPLIGCILILLSALVLFIPALSAGFLSDDFLDLHHDFVPDTFFRFEAGGFRPLTVAVWALDAHLWGPQRAWGWHATNLALHILNSALLFLLLRQMGFGRKAAFWGTLFFAVSWAAVPSVARVSGRTTMIALAPMLAALVLHAAWLKRGDFLRIFASCALFLASLLAKETMLLCAPLFGLFALFLRRDEFKSTRVFVINTLIFLVPTAVYALWRLAWLGPVLSYKESLSFGPFMIRSLAQLAMMPFSPWLDALPVRLLLLSGAVLLFIIKASWRAKALIAALLVLPLATVLNLPPRSDFAYAALPAASVAVAAIAGRARGWKGAAALGVLIIGCALSARDEVSRINAASAFTESEIDMMILLNRENPGDEFIFLSGVDYDFAGYGTIWLNAFTEALSTRGIYSDRFHDVGVLWETLYPSINAGELPQVLFTRLADDGEPALRFDTASRRWNQNTLQPSLFEVTGDGFIELSDSFSVYNSCFVWPVGSDIRILLPDPFNPCSLVAVEPAEMRSDTACFDLESRPEWLQIAHPRGFLIGFRGLNRAADAEFASERLWLSGLEERLEQKAVLEGQTR